MKCDFCEEKDSVIHVQQIMGSDIVDLYLCEKCAREKGIQGNEDRLEVSLSHLLNGLIEVKSKAEKHEENRTCAKCGTTFSSFRVSGRVGCTECFSVFRKDISALLEEMGAPAQHRGKYPKRLLTYKKFFIDREKLKLKLSSALEKEEYEKAAAIRDRIRALEEQGEAHYD